MSSDVVEVLNQLKEGKSPKVQRSLDALNEILRRYSESGGRDFSIKQIGRLSESRGGLTYNSLRATKNDFYRDLIEAYKLKSLKNARLLVKEKQRDPRTQDEFLAEKIDDPALKAAFMQIIKERNRYRADFNRLSSQTAINIDMRPEKPTAKTIEFMPSISGLLDEHEIEILKTVFSENELSAKNWEVTDIGSVKDEYGDMIFPPGFVEIIEKLIKAVE